MAKNIFSDCKTGAEIDAMLDELRVEEVEAFNDTDKTDEDRECFDETMEAFEAASVNAYMELVISGIDVDVLENA